MISGIEQVVARRIWFVPGFSVWGVPGLDEIELLTVEHTAAGNAVGFSAVTVEGASQEVLYADLIDHRGNQLPANLASPRVIPRSHEASAVLVVGTESPASFRIARDPNAVGPLTADLLVLEMGD